MSNEQIEDTKGTGEQAGDGRMDKPVEELKGYKPVTLRARGNTSWFFDLVTNKMTEFSLSTADAAERTLVELRERSNQNYLFSEENQRLQSELEKFKNSVDEANAEIDRLTKLISEEQPRLQDNEHIIVIDPKIVRVLNYVAKKRFESEITRERYKLKERENVGQLLINCMLTEDILFDFNHCFYTGLTREQLREFNSGRESANS